MSSGTSRTLVDFMLHVVPITDLPRPAAMDGAMLTGDAEVTHESLRIKTPGDMVINIMTLLPIKIRYHYNNMDVSIRIVLFERFT